MLLILKLKKQSKFCTVSQLMFYNETKLLQANNTISTFSSNRENENSHLQMDLLSPSSSSPLLSTPTPTTSKTSTASRSCYSPSPQFEVTHVRIFVPNAFNGQILSKSFPIKRGQMTVKELAKMVAHKMNITNSEDYALFCLVDGQGKLAVIWIISIHISLHVSTIN